MESGTISSVTDPNRKSPRTKTREEEEEPFSHLPKDILVNILLRLSIKSISRCKCVCKTLYDLISDAEFSKLRFHPGDVYPLIGTAFCAYGSAVLHLVQPSKDDFELKLGMCDHSNSKSGCVCNIRVKLDTKFEMPGSFGRAEYSLGTCNGLVCLSNPADKWLRPLAIGNPITVSGPTVNRTYRSGSMGVLGGELCICGVLESSDFHVWTMKDNGIAKDWSKVFSFNHTYIGQIRNYGSLLPIKYLNDGSLLLFYSLEDAFIYMDPKENRLRYLKVKGTVSEVEAIGYNPSFISLKHVVAGQKTEVLNVRSSCEKLMLHKEADIEIVEEEIRFDDDEEDDDDDDDDDNDDDDDDDEEDDLV